MRRSVILEVVTPHTGLSHHLPRGFAHADQMLNDRISRAAETDEAARWLRRCLHYLDRRFQRWLTVRLIEPFSLLGLFKVVRHRIRTYPTFILGGETYSGHDLAELEAFIRRQAGLMADDKHTTTG